MPHNLSWGKWVVILSKLVPAPSIGTKEKNTATVLVFVNEPR